MTLLPFEQFLTIREFFLNKARVLEQKLFQYHFENGSKESVYEELMKYQNEDGGFGRGLEPDFLLPLSSPMATSIAFQILTDLQTPFNHPMVVNGIKYLLNTFDEKRQIWISCPIEVNNYPHTPWWHFNNVEDDEELINQNFPNPTPELIGYLYEYKELVPKELLSNMIKISIQRLISSKDSIEMHGMLCYERFSQRLKDENTDIIAREMKNFLDLNLEKDELKWNGYCVLPLTFINSPDSIAARIINQTLIIKHFDYLLKNLKEDMIWLPSWSLEVYEEKHRNKAINEWKGIISLNNLIKFKNYKLIENVN